MDDKEKFLQEWKEKFHDEEPPDTSFLASLEHVREKIQTSEDKIDELELSIKKEEFLLNWLVTLEIELSVLGNVGTGHALGVNNDSVPVDELPRPSAPNSRDESSGDSHRNPFVAENRLSAVSTTRVDDNESYLATLQINENPNLDSTSCQGYQPADMKSEREKCFDTLTGGRDQTQHVIAPVSTGPVSTSSESTLKGHKLKRASPVIAASTSTNRLRSRSEACLDNVFDAQNKKDDQEIVLRDRRHSGQSNRRGGSWSTYLGNEFIMDFLPNSEQGNQLSDTSLDLSQLGTTSYDSGKEEQQNQQSSGQHTTIPIENCGSRDSVVIDNSNFSQEVSTFSQEMKQLTGKVVAEMNGKQTDITVPPKTINQEELEDEDEGIYENLKEYNVVNDDDDENIYENISDIHFGLHSRYLIPTLATGSDGSNSEYDSDPEHHDFEDSLTPPNFRRMTLDEIEKLSRWKSDEDLSQSLHDIDDKSGDSDDSLGRKRFDQRFGSDASDHDDFPKKNNRQGSEDGLIRKPSDRLKPGKALQDHHQDSSEETEDVLEDKTQRMRKYLVYNLLDSEKCYFDCLDMVKKYMKPLQKSLETSQPVLTKPDFDKIFSGIDGLYEMHKDFMLQLEPRLEVWSDRQVIGDILSVLMDGFNIYKQYVNNYKESMETLLKCRNANSTFAEIVKKDIKIPSLKEPIKFDGLLYKPVDRMTQYSLIMNDLLKYTPDDHPDHPLLVDATGNLFDLFEHVNVDRRKKKKPQRQLLKEGPVVELVDGERKARHLFLFNDILMCAKLKASKDAYVCKWYLSLMDIQLKPIENSETPQTVPVTTKTEIDKLRAGIANIRSEIRKESMLLSSVPSTDGSPFVRPKSIKRDSMLASGGSRASTRAMEKLRKKIIEQECLLMLIAPSLPMNVYHKTGRTITLLLTSEQERCLWKEAIAPRIKRMIVRGEGSVHLSNVEIHQALETCMKVLKLGPRLGSVLPSFFPGRSECRADEGEDDKKLTGYLYIHIQNGKGFAKHTDNYCILEVDSYGHFFKKAKTKQGRGPEPAWDEDFEFEVEASSSLRLTCFNRVRLMGDDISGRVTIDLCKENLTDNRNHTFAVTLDKGAITISLSFSTSLQDIQRTRSISEAGVFGVPIHFVARREKFDIPFIVISCIKEIEKRGLPEVGIYRLSGVASEVQALKKSFDDSPQSAAISLSEADIHAVAGLIKLYLRELPEPLFTYTIYERFVGGLQLADPEEKEIYMVDLLQQLPRPNKRTILYLFEHLRRVAKNASVNKMNLNNLSTVFGPNVLRPPKNEEPDKGIRTSDGRTYSTFDVGALDVMSQVSVFRYFLTLNSSKVSLPEDDLELWQRLDHGKASKIQEKLMETAVEYLI